MLPTKQFFNAEEAFQITPQGLRFRDLNSSNGIMVNGKRVKEGVLKVGDKLKVGASVLEVYGEPPSQAQS